MDGVGHLWKLPAESRGRPCKPSRTEGVASQRLDREFRWKAGNLTLPAGISSGQEVDDPHDRHCIALIVPSVLRPLAQLHTSPFLPGADIAAGVPLGSWFRYGRSVGYQHYEHVGR
jgi:hypothetical protein